jgi:hypothetical protein
VGVLKDLVQMPIELEGDTLAQIVDVDHPALRVLSERSRAIIPPAGRPRQGAQPMG